eukprot:c38675_g1_i1 orf=68-256(-)
MILQQQQLLLLAIISVMGTNYSKKHRNSTLDIKLWNYLYDYVKTNEMEWQMCCFSFSPGPKL